MHIHFLTNLIVAKMSKYANKIQNRCSADAVHKYGIINLAFDSDLDAIMKTLYDKLWESHIVRADVNPQVAASANFNNYRPTSIYGIAHAAIQIAYQSPAKLLILFMLINLGVGFVNMLPMLPLDGGYVAIAIYERLRTRRGQPNYHADVNKLTPVVVAFLAVLLVVFLSSLYLDIAHPLHL